MIDIRPATKEEFWLLPEIEDDADRAFVEAGVNREFPSVPRDYYVRELPNAFVLLALDDDKPVGFAAVVLCDGQPYLFELSVRYDYTRKGIGRALVAGTIDFAKAGAYRALTLTTCRDLPFNRPFYEKSGFEIFEPDQAAWPNLAATLKKERAEWRRVHERVAMIRML